MTLLDLDGLVHDFDPALVVAVESAGHPTETVAGPGDDAVPAPCARVTLKGDVKFLVAGPAGAVTAAIHRPTTQRSKEGW